MAYEREQLKRFVLRAVEANPAGIGWIDCAKHIWNNNQRDHQELGDLFFTWQYDMRWAMQVLRDEGRVENVGRGRWALKRP